MITAARRRTGRMRSSISSMRWRSKSSRHSHEIAAAPLGWGTESIPSGSDGATTTMTRRETLWTYVRLGHRIGSTQGRACTGREDARSGTGGVRQAARGAGGRAGRARPRRGAGAPARRAGCATPTCTPPRASTLGLRADGARPRGRGRRRALRRGRLAGARGRPRRDAVLAPVRRVRALRQPRTNLCLAIREQQNLGYLPDGTTRLSRAGEPLRHFMGTSTFAEYTVMPEIALAQDRPARRRSTAPACSPAASRRASARR